MMQHSHAACPRQTIYLPVPGLVPTEELTPGDLVGTNKDSYLILEKLPAEYDNRVKAMEVDEKPTEEYSDIGGELRLFGGGGLWAVVSADCLILNTHACLGSRDGL